MSWLPTVVSEVSAPARTTLWENVLSDVGGYEDDVYKNAVKKHFLEEVVAIVKILESDGLTRLMGGYQREGRSERHCQDPCNNDLATRPGPQVGVIDTPTIAIPPGADQALIDLTVETHAPRNLSP